MSRSHLMRHRRPAALMLGLTCFGCGEVPADVEDDPNAQAVSLTVSGPTGDVAPGLPVAVEVTAVDALGNTVASYSGDVTLNLSENAQGATLTGATTVALAAGAASFGGLEISRAGSSFTLSAETADLSGISEPFDVRLRLASISVGTGTICGLSHAGEAYCWGRNQTGGLGIGTSGEDVSRPTLVAGDLTFVQVDAGHTSNQNGQFDGFACGVAHTGDAYCWGRNQFGQLGDGSTGGVVDHPVQVSGGLSFASVTAGRDHACGLTTDGAAYCWGSNGGGRLGTGSNQPELSNVPIAVTGGLVYEQLVIGLFRSCGIATDDVTYCWNSNTGLPASTLFTPTPIPGSVTLRQIEPGAFTHLCGVDTSGAGYCWGRNTYGELGTGDEVERAEPAIVAGGHEWAMIGAGWESTCGLRTDGVAMCWGRDRAGETGQGTWGENDSVGSEPLPVVGGLIFTELAAGTDTLCGLVEGGVAYCWGAGYRGERGDGTFDFHGPIPVRVLPPGGG